MPIVTVSEQNEIVLRCPFCNREIAYAEQMSALVQACPYCSKPVVVANDGSGFARRLPLPICSRRLILDRFTTENLPDLKELLTDAESYAYSDLYPPDEDDVQFWYEASSNTQLTDPDGYTNLAVRLKDDQKVIAYISLYFSDRDPKTVEHRSGAFTMMVTPRYRNRGYGREIVGAILGFGFEGINLHDIRASVQSANTAACKALLATGMRKEAEFLERDFVKGRWVDIACFGLLQREHAAARAAKSPLVSEVRLGWK